MHEHELVGLYLLGVIVWYAVLVWRYVDSMADTNGICGFAVLSVMWPAIVLGGIVAGPFFGLTYTLMLLKDNKRVER